MFDNVGMMLLKLLAVLGGAALGAVLARFLLFLLVRIFTRRRLPQPLRALVAALGAIGGGLLVWLLMFSQTGGFGGGGGGWWPFGGPGTGTGNGPPGLVQPGPIDTSPRPIDRPVRVHMLGGSRVQEGRFYVLEGQPPLTLPELRQALLNRTPRPSEVQIVIYQDSVDQANPAVTELVQWLKENRIRANLLYPGTKAP
jgi:hypothetical protein